MLSIRLTLKKILQKMKIIDDYVVESSSEGDWTWQKWDSGIVHLWGVHNYADGDIKCATKYGSLYTSGNLSLTLPFALVDHEDTAAITMSVRAAGVDFPAKVSINSPTTIQYRWVNPSEYDSNGVYNVVRAHIQISGRWKA